MDNRSLALLSAEVMENKKAEDVTVLHIEGKASFADYLVIASGRSERQIGARADDVQDAYAEQGVIARSVEGKKESGWILMDFGDVIVNVLTEEMRERYKIEKVWADCEVIKE